MEEFDSIQIVEEHELECEESISAFKRDMQKMRTGRASTNLVSGIFIDYYGSRTQLSHLGQVSSPEPRQIVIQVYDSNAVDIIEKALRTAEFAFNPSREGNTLRILIPALTEQTRKDIVKHLHKMAEEKRVAIRNHRRDANDKIKKGEKDGALSKDDSKRVLEEIQEQTDKRIAEIDSLLSAKEAECMEV
jgi:ribosome recycling factor